MNEENMTEIPREGEPLATLDSLVKETPADSSTETTQDEDTPSQEGEMEPKAPNIPTESTVPFNEHPRWKEQQAELAELRRQNQDVMQYLQQVPQYLDSVRSQLTSKDQPIPEWFKELYGDSPKAYQLYQQSRQQEKQEMQQQIFADMASQQRQQTESAHYWVGQVESEFKRLEQNGKTFDREELKAVLLNFKPTTDAGLLDFEKAYDILQAQKAAAGAQVRNQERKKIADATSPTSAGEKGAKDYKTTADIRGITWGSL